MGECKALTQKQRLKIQAKFALHRYQGAYAIAALVLIPLGGVLALKVAGGLMTWATAALIFAPLAAFLLAPIALLFLSATVYPPLEERLVLDQTLLLEQRKHTAEAIEGGLTLTQDGDSPRGALTQAADAGGLTSADST